MAMGPRRAFEVTCAIQFSKSKLIRAPPPLEKADGESSRGQNRSQTRFSVGLIPCGKCKIGGSMGPVNPPTCTTRSARNTPIFAPLRRPVASR